MSTHEQTRRAHALVDALKGGATLSSSDADFLRSFLPEPPKQKTLREIAEHVRDAWTRTIGNNWDGNSYNTDISNEDWLRELFEQLRGLNDVPAAVPALPAGMRLADHKDYGRCVVSPGLNDFGLYLIFVLDSDYKEGAHWHCEHGRTLTFIDANAPDTQVIRTPEELEALDPDTVFMNTWGDLFDANNVHAGINTDDFPYYFPCSVVASGDQLRAAREAMEQEYE